MTKKELAGDCKSVLNEAESMDCNEISTIKILFEDIKTIVQALEKQIPFKPEIKKIILGVGRCKCGAEFLTKDTNYCGNCGQKIDWSESDEQKFKADYMSLAKKVRTNNETD